MTKVVKFGGSSLASAEQFKKVKEIITAESSRRFVVPSAPGKRFSNDTKVTDMLYGCYDLAAKGKDFSSEFDAIKERYYGIINDLGLDLSLEKEFETIKACFIGKAGRDYAASILTVSFLLNILDITLLTLLMLSILTIRVSSILQEQTRCFLKDLLHLTMR